MTILAPAPALTLQPRAAEPAFPAEILCDFDTAEAPWRELEASGIASPYQRFDWQQAYAGATGAGGRCEHCLILLRDHAGRAALMLPLAIERRAGLRIAAPIGGKHANYHLPLMASGAALPSPAELRFVLREIGRRQRIDAYAFSNLPPSWHGTANPLAEGGWPSPSNGYRLALCADPEEVFLRVMSKDARKKIRQKDKKLRERGPVAHLVARTPEEADRILAAFLEQKRARMREIGVANPFEDPGTQAFLLAAARAGLAEGSPALELHALTLGERIVATFGAAVDDVRCCGMFTAFDAEPEIARASPGELLMLEVIRYQCRRGRRFFDLGVGEARYKSSLCDEVEELVDTVLPVTLRGRAYAAAATGFMQAKRVAKRSRWLRQATGWLQALATKRP